MIADIFTTVFIFSVIFLIYYVVKIINSYLNNGNKKEYKKKAWISAIVLVISFIIVGCTYPQNQGSKKEGNSKTNVNQKELTNKNNRENAEEKNKQKQQRKVKLQKKLASYPSIQQKAGTSNLDSLSDNTLMNFNTKATGKIISWGAGPGNALILFKLDGSNQLMLASVSSDHRDGQKIEEQEQITTYGGFLTKDKVNDSDTERGMDTSYFGKPVIKIDQPDFIRTNSAKDN